MKLGMVGLGRMGANMAIRIPRRANRWSLSIAIPRRSNRW